MKCKSFFQSLYGFLCVKGLCHLSCMYKMVPLSVASNFMDIIVI